MSPLALVFLVSMLVFVVLFIVDAIRFRADVRKYATAGLAFGLTMLLFELVVLAFAGDSFIVDESACCFLLVADSLMVAKVALFASVGSYYCTSLGCPSTPLLLRMRGLGAREPVMSQSVQDEAALPDGLSVGEVELLEEADAPATATGDETPNWRAGVAWALAVAAGGVLYSCLLFDLTMPRMSEFLRQAMESSNVSLSRMGMVLDPTAMDIVIVCSFAFGEEIMFRLGIQNFLAGKLCRSGSRYAAAIVLTAALWSLAHTNVLDPEWVKLAQIFPLGVALGYLFRKFGVEVCILAHGALNVAMAFLGPRFIEV